VRVTSATRQATLRRILQTAAELFATKGFEAATTRDLSRAAGIATGTLFNYFPTKEAIVQALLDASLAEGRAAFARRLHGDEELDEVLFAHVAASLRCLAPHREYLKPALDGALAAPPTTPLATLREGHLQVVRERLTAHGWNDATGDVTMHLYWALFVGIVTFWLRDSSPRQEATLALTDKSMKLFVQSLSLFGGLPK